MDNFSFSLSFLKEPDKHHTDALFCFFEGDQLLEVGTTPGVLSPLEDMVLVQPYLWEAPVYIGEHRGLRYFAQELKTGAAEQLRLSGISLRTLAANDELLFIMLGRGMQLLSWRRSHRYCGRCGNSNTESNIEHVMHCPRCEASYYPKIMPCVMALVTRGNQCLLAKHKGRGTGLFTALAGFIEAGESAEHAVYREVKEEVGLEVGSVNYFASQPWPFPGQLMLGYFAEHGGGDIRLDEEEIADAQWFDSDHLPEIPAPYTLSGKMIRAFAEAQRR